MKFTMLKNRTQIYNENLCKEIFFTAYDGQIDMTSFYEPLTSTSKYMFSRTKWYEVDINHALRKDINNVRKWCKEQFGQHPKNPDAWSRWHSDGFRIRFSNPKDYEWFMLRWS